MQLFGLFVRRAWRPSLIVGLPDLINSGLPRSFLNILGSINLLTEVIMIEDVILVAGEPTRRETVPGGIGVGWQAQVQEGEEAGKEESLLLKIRHGQVGDLPVSRLL